MSMTIKKPELQTRTFYDYFECRDYIIEKHPELTKAADDYWSDCMIQSEVNNGSFWTISDDLEPDNEDQESWNVFENALKKEFGTEHGFYVWW